MGWQLSNVYGTEVYIISDKDFIVGRDVNTDLCCKNFAVSRKHAAIKICDGHVKIIDYNSLNGTYVNNNRIVSNEFNTLKENDIVSFGMFTVDGELVKKNENEKVYFFKLETKDAIQVIPQEAKIIEPLYINSSEEIIDTRNNLSTSSTPLNKMELTNADEENKLRTTTQIVVKMEINAEKVAYIDNGQLVTIIDSDDEDDYKIMISQLFSNRNNGSNFQHEMKEVKKEYDYCDDQDLEQPVVFNHEDKIKHELQELDFLDQPIVYDPIDLETPEQTVEGLQAILEDSVVSENYDNAKNINNEKPKPAKYADKSKEKNEAFSHISLLKAKDGEDGKNNQKNKTSSHSKYLKAKTDINKTNKKNRASTQENLSKAKSIKDIDKSKKAKKASYSNLIKAMGAKDINKSKQKNKSSHSNLLNDTILNNETLLGSTKNKTNESSKNTNKAILIEPLPNVRVSKTTTKRKYPENIAASKPSTSTEIKRAKLDNGTTCKTKENIKKNCSKGKDTKRNHGKQDRIETATKQRLDINKSIEKSDPRLNTKVSHNRGKKEIKENTYSRVSIPSTSGASNFKIPNIISSKTVASTSHAKTNGIPNTNGVPVYSNVETCQSNNLPGFYSRPRNFNENRDRSDKNILNKFEQLNSPNIFDNFAEQVLTVIKWNYKWMKEQKSVNDIPPVTNNVPPVRMSNNYENFKDYYTGMKTLILLDYWYSICSEFENDCYSKDKAKSTTFEGAIEKVDVKKTHIELTCYSYLFKNGKQPFQDRHFVLLNYKYDEAIDEGNKVFGVVLKTSKQNLHDGNNWTLDKRLLGRGKVPKVPEIKLTYVIAVQILPNNFKINKVYNAMVGRCFSSFPQMITKIASLKCLEKSPLIKSILDPSIEDYKLQNNDTNRIMNFGLNLNTSQKYAITEGVNLYFNKKPGIYLIEGPPGTGKSEVILNTIFHIIKTYDKARILLLAPSNGAVDSLFSKYLKVYKAKTNLKAVRFGNTERISKDVIDFSLDELAKSNLKKVVFKRHRPLQKSYDELKKKLETLTKDENYRKKSLELTNFVRDSIPASTYNKYLDINRKKILEGAQVVFSTIGSCPNLSRLLPLDHHFDLCIIDESTQSSEIDTLIVPSLGINKIILVGDPKQLPAMTNHFTAKDLRYGQSLFERLKNSLSKYEDQTIRLLDVQYRMHPEIASFPNFNFYDGRIKNAQNVGNCICFKYLRPYMIFGRDYKQENAYESPIEAQNIVSILGAILQIIDKRFKVSIGIITFYNKQRDIIVQKINESLNIDNQHVSITCNTIDSFQGQEKDIILFSCVRNNSNSFLSDQQRINVALTRAKYGLFILGALSLFEDDDFYKKLKEDAVKRKLFNKLTSVRCSTAEFKKYLKCY